MKTAESRFFPALAMTVLILLVTAPLALAKSVNLFGPQSFVRAEGKPQVFRSSFPLPPSVTQCQLLVTTATGEPISANNVSIRVNGTELVDAKELRNADGTVLEGVELKSENSIEVLLKGKPGDSVQISVVGTAPDGPTRPPRPVRLTY